MQNFRRRIMKKLLIFCLAVGFVFAISGMAQAGTIQDKIDLASTGDTINISAGTYIETVTVNKEVTLLGANYDVDPAGSTDRGSESVITGAVKITADNVTVNGFKMTSSSYIEISDASHSALNVNVSYNILENTTWADGAVDLNGGNRCAGGYIGYNTISGASGYGIQTIQNDGVIIEHNHVLNSSGFAAIDAGYHVGTGIVIHGNTITDSGGKGINYWAEDGGVITDNVISNSNFEAIYTDAQATISGNQISGGGMYGIFVMPWTSGTAAGSTVSGNTISDTNWEGIQSDVPVTITYNDISGGYSGIQLSNDASGSVIDGNNIHDNDGFGLSILDSVTDVIVKNNQLANNPWCGVVVWGYGEGFGIHINCNEITGNGFGVYSERTSDVDAECNWWGAVDGPSNCGPGLGDAVSDNVDFEPWLLSEAPDAVCYEYYEDGFGEIVACAVDAKNHGKFVRSGFQPLT
jgi:parallel beta-helix repeat protein